MKIRILMCVFILAMAAAGTLAPAQVTHAGTWCDMARFAGGYHQGLNLACALEFFMEIGLQYYFD